MQINRCPKCGKVLIVIAQPSDDSEGRVISYKLGCRHCEMFVSMNGDLTSIDEALTKWNELTKGENK